MKPVTAATRRVLVIERQNQEPFQDRRPERDRAFEVGAEAQRRRRWLQLGPVVTNYGRTA